MTALDDARRGAEEALKNLNAIPAEVLTEDEAFAAVALRALLDATAKPQPLGPVDLAALPVHFVSVLPRGHIFMHPDTPKSGVRDPWPPPMPSTPFRLDGDGRDWFNDSEPFEG